VHQQNTEQPQQRQCEVGAGVAAAEEEQRELGRNLALTVGHLINWGSLANFAAFSSVLAALSRPTEKMSLARALIFSIENQLTRFFSELFPKSFRFHFFLFC
jgi:hypothetical protein